MSGFIEGNLNQISQTANFNENLSTIINGDEWTGSPNPDLGEEDDDGKQGTTGEKVSINGLFPNVTVNSQGRSVRMVDANVVETVGVINQKGPVQVTVQSPGENYEIRYTTNGKNPTFNSTLYSGPISLIRNLTGSDNTVFKFRAYNKNNNTVRSKVTKIVVNVY